MIVTSIRLKQLGALFFLLTATSVLAEDYEVRLSAPSKPGDKIRYSAVGIQTERTETSSGSKVLNEQNQEIAAELETVVTVAEVHASGEPSKLSHEVISCTLTRGESDDVTFPKGTVIVDSRKSADEPLIVNDQKINKALNTVLDLVIPPHDFEGANDEAWMGTDKRVKIGESWKLDPQRLIDTIGRPLNGLFPNQVKGSATLVGKEKIAGEECLKFASTFTFSDFTVPLPPGFRILSSRLISNISITLASDKSSPVADLELNQKVFIVAQGEDAEGNPITVNSDTERAVQINLRRNK